MKEVLLHLMVLTVFVEGLAVGSVTSGRAVSALVILVIAFTLAARPGAGVLPHPWVAVPAVLLAALVLLTGIWAPAGVGWRGDVLELALAMALFLGYSLLIDSRALVYRLLVSYAVGATLVAPVACWQFAQGLRAVGFQGDPNTFALYQLAALPVVGQLWVRRGRGGRVLWAGSAALLLASVLAAQSRGAALALVVVVMWLLATGAYGSIPRRARLGAVAVGGSLLAVGAVAAVSLLPRFDVAATREGGGTGRLDIWRAAWSAWSEQPGGLGAGGFEQESGRLLSQTPGIGLDPRSALFEGIKIHNSYLESLVDLGPVGLVLFVALLTGIALLLVEDRRRHPEELTASLVPMLLAFATAAIFLSVVSNKLLWMLAGFAGVLTYLPARTPPPVPEVEPALQPSKGTP